MRENTVTNPQFWRATAERALSTVLQAGIAALPIVGTITPTTGIADINWLAVLNIALLAGALSVAKNLIVGLSGDGNPSIGSAEELPVEPRRALPETSGEGQ